MDNANQYDLILVVVNRGNVDTVMDAAREGGARGSTVLHARRVGLEDGENLLGSPSSRKRRSSPSCPRPRAGDHACSEQGRGPHDRVPGHIVLLCLWRT